MIYIPHRFTQRICSPPHTHSLVLGHDQIVEKHGADAEVGPAVWPLPAAAAVVDAAVAACDDGWKYAAVADVVAVVVVAAVTAVDSAAFGTSANAAAFGTAAAAAAEPVPAAAAGTRDAGAAAAAAAVGWKHAAVVVAVAAGRISVGAFAAVAQKCAAAEATEGTLVVVQLAVAVVDSVVVGDCAVAASSDAEGALWDAGVAVPLGLFVAVSIAAAL